MALTELQSALFTEQSMLSVLDAGGQVVRNISFEGTGLDLDVTPGGDILVTGVGKDIGTVDDDLLIIRFDAAGNVMFRRYFEGTGGEQLGRSIISTSDGGMAIAGDTRSSRNGSSEIYFLKLNSEGKK